MSAIISDVFMLIAIMAMTIRILSRIDALIKEVKDFRLVIANEYQTRDQHESLRERVNGLERAMQVVTAQEQHNSQDITRLQRERE